MEGKYRHPLPAVLGHESAGVVEAIGSEVRTCKVGDHVITCLSVFCGHCDQCLTGHMSLCVNPETRRKKGDEPRLYREGPAPVMNQYLNLLRLDGTLCLVGLPEVPPTISPFAIITNRRSLSGSMIGGVEETQGMLDYCAEKNIVADVEVIGYDRIEEAYQRVVKSDVKYRFVLDSSTLKKA